MFGIDWLKGKARDWAQEVVKLYNTPVTPALQPEKDRLLKRARTIKETIEKVTGPLEPLSPLNPIINELGAFWIPVGAAVGVSAAAAAIAYWYRDHKQFMERVAMEKRLAAEGVPANQRTALVNQALGPPGGRSLAETLFDPKAFLPLALLGIGGLWLWTNRSR